MIVLLLLYMTSLISYFKKIIKKLNFERNQFKFSTKNQSMTKKLKYFISILTKYPVL